MNDGKFPADMEDSLISTVQVALHCARWGTSTPVTDGALAWEEYFVGPLVSHAFAELLKPDPGTSSVRVAWKGWVHAVPVVCSA